MGNNGDHTINAKIKSKPATRSGPRTQFNTTDSEIEICKHYGMSEIIMVVDYNTITL